MMMSAFNLSSKEAFRKGLMKYQALTANRLGANGTGPM